MSCRFLHCTRPINPGLPSPYNNMCDECYLGYMQTLKEEYEERIKHERKK